MRDYKRIEKNCKCYNFIENVLLEIFGKTSVLKDKELEILRKK